MSFFPFLYEKKKKTPFVQEYLYIEPPLPQQEPKEFEKESEETERGVLIIDLNGEED